MESSKKKGKGNGCDPSRPLDLSHSQFKNQPTNQQQQEMTGEKPAIETDTLLPKAPPPPGLRLVWSQATAADKTLMLLGALGAIAGGCASGLTYVLYGRLLDAMARATLDGVDAILVQYGQLAAVELVGVWLQFLTWSRAASHRKQRKIAEDGEEEEAKDGYVEALGQVFYETASGLTALGIALYFGWDSLLAIVVVMGLTALVPWAMNKWLSKRTKDKDSGKETAVVKATEEQKLLEKEVDELWRHARALKLMDATAAARDRVLQLISHKHKAAKGMMVLMTVAISLPVAVAMVYTAWKVRKNASSGSAALLAVVFLAGWTSMTSLQRAWTTYSTGDFSLKKSKETLQLRTKPAEDVSEAAKARALDWLRSLSRLSAWEATFVWSALIFKTVIYIAIALALGSSFAWLLQMPFTTQASMRTAWKYAFALILAGVGLGLAFEGGIAAQGTVCTKVRQTVFLQTFMARLEVPDETITGKMLVEDSSHIAMYSMSLVEPPNAGTMAICSLGLAVGFYIDPSFSIATLVVLPVTYLPYAFHVKRDKALYRSFFDRAWLITVLESLVRATIHVVPRLAVIVMAYIQTQWIFSGRSTLFSIFAVQSLCGTCFSIYNANRISFGVFIHDEALAAAARLQAFISKADHAGQVHLSSRDDGGASHSLQGELCVTPTVDGITTQKRLRDGALAVLASDNTDALQSVSQSLLRLDQSASVSATVDGVDIASLALASVRNCIMVIDADPVRFPGTLKQNIRVGSPTASPQECELAAQRAELPLNDLDTELTLDKWLTGPGTAELKQRVLTARILLRKPDIVIVEDFTTSEDVDPTDQVDLVETVATIRQEIPQCKVLVVTTPTIAGVKWDAQR